MYNSGKVSCAFFKVGQLLKKGHFNVSSAVKVAQLLLVCVLCQRRLCETRRMADYLSQLASSAPSKGHFEAAQMAVGGYLHTAAASKTTGS